MDGQMSIGGIGQELGDLFMAAAMIFPRPPDWVIRAEQT
jgi:hypothetical protein